MMLFLGHILSVKGVWFVYHITLADQMGKTLILAEQDTEACLFVKLTMSIDLGYI